MGIEDRSSQKTSIPRFKLLHELELTFGVVLLTDTMRHIIQGIPGRKMLIEVAQEASRVV
jgi:hypothetical protein